ncbi:MULTISPECIES: thioredoxin fold domain-containing protein [Malaciobacter]|uniref:Thiol:disulfide interchange protein n=2 Tax=Malaciobacter TaxID=2321114 RepID=A0A347TK56_9BACT|nr:MULTISPECIES: thioredoxin fold domain-containing protein [Malaciobacter]AXX86984.1 thiol:disulfide interchange protein [Malaciobacter marinus]PHO08992.1 thiol:disulfide interchange protein [Malaciobacter canalis]PHO13144.1 thiol:disulfide interchange protein [Malaciobacter marinus]PHO14113.1 thiol:disulfide interchange protein [Malaciobacter marinus]QEE32766.1 thiol:disulfide interchange protein [Malaciobacter canalis]
MTKILKLSLLVFSFLSVLNAYEPKEVTKEEIKQINNLNLLQKADIKVSKAFDMGSIYILDSIIQGKPQELFLTKDKKVLIAGNVMDVNSGDAITLPVDLSNTIGKEALTYGSGKDEYVLFTDPECPYCKKLESFFPKLEKHVKIRVFFFPLSFHNNARDLSIYFMSKKTNEEKIKAMLNTNADSKEFKNRKISKDELAKLEKSLEEQMIIAQKLNIRGTPTLFNKDGKKLVWVELLKKYNIDLQ